MLFATLIMNSFGVAWGGNVMGGGGEVGISHDGQQGVKVIILWYSGDVLCHWAMIDRGGAAFYVFTKEQMKGKRNVKTIIEIPHPGLNRVQIIAKPITSKGKKKISLSHIMSLPGGNFVKSNLFFSGLEEMLREQDGKLA